MPLFFRFDLFIEARAEILENFLFVWEEVLTPKGHLKFSDRIGRIEIGDNEFETLSSVGK